MDDRAHQAARRLQAKSQRSGAPAGSGGEDPDIAGIVPGPQPSPWGDDEPLAEDE